MFNKVCKKTAKKTSKAGKPKPAPKKAGMAKTKRPVKQHTAKKVVKAVQAVKVTKPVLSLVQIPSSLRGCITQPFDTNANSYPTMACPNNR